MPSTPLPTALRTADIPRFAHRAAQLAKHRPIIAYWLDYHILQTVLSRQLHTIDAECQTYALDLMTVLEAQKAEAETAHNDAITDDVAAKVYVENFALEVFTIAEEAMRRNKVGKQTADTFQAAATFLDLLAIWGEVEKESREKSKFAKFHALRIAKAIKAGEDPNETNPVVEQPGQVEGEEEEGIEAELRDMQNGAGSGSGVYRPPTVESIPPSVQPSRPDSTVPGELYNAPPPLLPITTPPEEPREPPAEPEVHDVSPIEPATSTANRQGSLGGGYFPAVPQTPATDTEMLDLPDVQQPRHQPQPPPLSSPQDFYQQHQPLPPPPPRAQAPPPVQQTYLPAPQPPPPAVQQTGYRTDDDAVLAAQKHAKWAISALNFEDVNTAVRELRLALRELGAG